MSPILDLQLRLRQLGTLRMGELATRNGKTYPTTRDTWRITTSDHKIAEQVAAQFGGTPTEWDSRSAERYAVDTTVDALPIAVVPGHAISQWFELWTGGGCVRRCDGNDELIGDQPCQCDPEHRECKPTTRLSVVVRGIDALGLFRLNTGGYYAAVELGGAVSFLEQRTSQGEVLDGWLRIEERRVVRDGKTKVFKVPVLDVAYGIDRMLPTSPQVPALPAGYTPIEPVAGTGVTLAQGLALTETQTLPSTGRSAAPIPRADDVLFGDTPVPVPDDGLPEAEPEKRSGAQTKKLNVLVGRFRDVGHDPTAWAWNEITSLRRINDVQQLVKQLNGIDHEGVLHWAPLRDSLTKDEASTLIDQLEKWEGTLGGPE